MLFTCSFCMKQLPRSSFYVCKDKRNGITSRCKNCRKTHKDRICGICDKKYSTAQYKSKFCSYDCYHKSLIKRTMTFCTHCAGEFMAKAGDVRRGGGKFCTRTCYIAYRSGKRKPDNGYIKLYLPKHPMASKRGTILEHRFAMSEKLGRLLKSNEYVHHVNGDRSDNRAENLELWVGVGKQPSGVRFVDSKHCSTCKCNA